LPLLPPRHERWSIALVAAALAIVVHLHALRNGFVLDDIGVVTQHPVLQQWDGVWRAFVSPWWPNGAGQYRPLVLSSFTVEWLLGGGSPLPFHALNLLWHGLATALVVLLLRPWLSRGATWVAGLVFAVHPVHVEAVANVVGRAELMASVGVLGALLLHRARSPWAVLATAAAMASKEHAIAVLALFPLVDWFDDAREGNTPTRVRPWSPSVRWLYVGYLGVIIAWFVAVALLFGGVPVTATHPLWLTSSVSERVLTMLGVVPTWLRLAVWPFDLSIDYGPRVTVPWPDGWYATILGALALLLLGVLAAATWRRTPAVALAVAWIVVTLAPVANVLVPTGMVTAERSLYLPSVGIALAFGLVAQVIGQVRWERAIAFGGLVLLAFGVRTVTRVPVWESGRALVLTSVAEHPESSHIRHLLARVYVAMGDSDAALDQLLASVALFDRAEPVWVDVVRMTRRAGRLAAADSLAAVGLERLGPSFALWAERGDLALSRSDALGAETAISAASRIAPDSVRPRFQRLQLRLLQGDVEGALAAVRELPPGTDYRVFADSLLRSGAVENSVRVADSLPPG
jgi:hypothetical protein